VFSNRPFVFPACIRRILPMPVKTFGLFLSFTLIAAGCRSVEPRKTNAQLQEDLQSTLNDFIATNPTIAGVALHIEMPRRQISWSGAAGVADRLTGVPLMPNQPIRIASNTKTFVAAAILRLWEGNRLDLDGSIDRYLSDQSVRTLLRGGYDPRSITLRHLLTHTSGLFDFGDSDEYNKLCTENPQHHWTREEQLSFAMKGGKPYGAPGEVFAYSDTGYILLGEVLERQTGTAMALALRNLVGYQRLGLRSTWLETAEPPPKGVLDRAHQYEGERDTYTDDPSYDLYGGGGLVSTVHDMAVFMRALFQKQVYANPNTINTMLSTVPGALAGPPAYGVPQKPGEGRMGVFVRVIDGVTVYMHTGYWGTLAAYIPELDLGLAISVTQQKAREPRELLFRKVLQICHSNR
jgi:D-alanyl-D-alanine carboxypeptidase